MISEINLDHFLDNLPGFIWIKDCESKYIACNKNIIKLTKLANKNEIIGRNDQNAPWAEYAEIYRAADKIALDGKTKKFLHPIRFGNDQYTIILTKKSPVYDQRDKIIGIKGSIYTYISPAKLQSFISLHKLDTELLGSYEPFQYTLADDYQFKNLSKREAICLYYLVRGKTAKEVAEILFLSKRTVETHIDRIRIKLNCKTKSEIIGMAIDEGFLHFLPGDYLINKLYDSNLKGGKSRFRDL